ncbi:protein YdhT [Musicola keenii]|uniref:protein YdhT n=1 Tax=Musicola keenii TaxID=2884250 RepID=UPI00178030E6|nr:protein YdhT [Musicola keenii]
MNPITRRHLHRLKVSPQIYRWFLRRFPQGAHYPQLHDALLHDGYREWMESLVDYSYAQHFSQPFFVRQELAATRSLLAQLLSTTVAAAQNTPDIMENGPYTLAISAADQRIGSASPQGRVASTGDGNLIGCQGEHHSIASTGYACQLVSAGCAAHVGNTGPNSRIGALGERARIANSGNAAKIVSDGHGSHIASTGSRTYISGTGDRDRIVSAGDMCCLHSLGDSTHITATGEQLSVTACGADSVVVVVGSMATLLLGQGGCAAITYHDGVRTRFRVIYAGEDGVRAGVRYRLTTAGELEACE